jgi:hypothetical protein
MFTKPWWQMVPAVFFRLASCDYLGAGLGALASSALKSAGERVPVPQLLLTLTVSTSIAALLALGPGL